MTDARTLEQRAPPDSNPACSTCGTFKQSGKVSCCARGGSWYQKCGVGSGPGSYHTWADGIRVCNDFVPEAAAHINPAQTYNGTQTIRSQDAPKNVTRSQSKDVGQERAIDESTDNDRYSLSHDATGRVTRTEVFFCVSFSFIVHHVSL